VSTLVASSEHHRLKNSVNKFIVPLLRELYLHSTTAGNYLPLLFFFGRDYLPLLPLNLLKYKITISPLSMAREV
jgi:hypothetical protein